MELKQIILSPYYQAGLIVLLTILALIFYRIMDKPVAGWNASALLLLLFCIINAIAGIFVSHIGMYLLKSIGMFIVLFLLAFLISSVISGMNYRRYGENAMIFAAPVFYYPFMLAIMGIIRLVRKMI